MDLEQLEPCAAELLEAPPRSGPREAASVLRSLGTQCGKHVAARVEEEIHSLVSRGGTRSAKKVRKHVMKRASRVRVPRPPVRAVPALPCRWWRLQGCQAGRQVSC